MAADTSARRSVAAWLVAAVLAVAAALGVIGTPLAHGDETPASDSTPVPTTVPAAIPPEPTSPVPATTGGPAIAGPAVPGTRPAVRLPAMQVTETLPPPTFTTTGPGDSLEIPDDSGIGRRVVYSKTIMRVWLIEEDGSVFHTHRVSGLDAQPKPGTYAVWSRSSTTCARSNPSICMRFMVRFARSFRGDNIGFHEIPRRNGVPLQDISQLGLALSGGCVRQATDDAIVMWNWAQLGTAVVVVA